jgi:hypothetical protein
MNRLLAPFALALLACAPTVTTTDAAIQAAMVTCRYPRSCYRVPCSCAFADVSGACNVGSDQDCDSLDLGVPDGGAFQCLETTEVCIGKGPVCQGVHANCVRAGSSCITPGDPPELIPVADPDAGPTEVPRCPYVDDICCS